MLIIVSYFFGGLRIKLLMRIHLNGERDEFVTAVDLKISASDQ